MPLGFELRDGAWERNWLKELLLVSELVKLVLDEPVVDTVVEGLGLTELVWLWVEEGELLEVIVSDGVSMGRPLQRRKYKESGLMKPILSHMF